MKNFGKLLNTLLLSLSLVVAAIFIYGALKPSDHKVDQIEQSSVSLKKPARSLSEQDELTNKYMKELQNKLRKDELEQVQELKKAQEVQKNQNAKDDDWTKIPLEQQISKDGPADDTENDRSVAGIRLNKDTAAEFVETARKNGYHVVLSNTYEVLSIAPILNSKGINDTLETNPAQ